MKTLLLLLAVVSLLVLPQMALANHDEGHEARCCIDGSSPWASQSEDAWRPNAKAGFQGSDLHRQPTPPLSDPDPFEDFQMCFKVWEEITIPIYAKHARYGVRAGQPNPRFLDAKLFEELVLTPYREAKFESRTPARSCSSSNGTVCPQTNSAHGLTSSSCGYPGEFRYAVEIRTPVFSVCPTA